MEGKQITMTAPLSFSDIEARADGSRPKRAKIKAYTGGLIRVAAFYNPVVIDLAGMKSSGKSIPILRDHNPEKIVGHTDSVAISATDVDVDGIVSAENEHSREIVASSKNGFPWQASVGASVEQLERLGENEKAKVNGKTVKGPAIIARKTVLNEVSIVPLGADRKSETKIAAKEGTKMEESSTQDPMVEKERQAGIMAIDMSPELKLQAISEDWTVEQAQAKAIKELKLEAMRASRPSSPSIQVANRNNSLDVGKVYEASMALTAGASEKTLAGEYTEAELNAAMSKEYRGVGLHSLIRECHVQAGLSAPKSIGNEAIQTAMRPQIQAGFSTLSLPGILGNTANKVLLDSYQAVNTTWPFFAAVGSNRDFKSSTRYRMVGMGEFAKVGAGGEIKHLPSPEEQSYATQLETHAAMFAITRQSIINDDLDALAQFPRILGRKGATKVEKTVYELIIANTGSHFSSGNNNYFDGASTNLQSSSLETALQKFLDQTDENGDPVMIKPEILLVPTAEALTARELVRDTSTVILPSVTDRAGAMPTGNPHAGQYKPVVSPWLSSLSGGSSLAWYLLAAPGDFATIEVAFLNGQRTPVVESAEADFNTLGVQMRAYFDFDVAFRDPRGGVKSKGEA